MGMRYTDKGTYAETALVKYLRDEVGFTDDECNRRAKYGGGDRGDVHVVGVPLVVEVKNTKTLRLTKWEAEVRAEMVNASAR